MSSLRISLTLTLGDIFKLYFTAYGNRLMNFLPNTQLIKV